MSNPRERRGRCTACRLVLCWRGLPLLCDAGCTKCGGPLVRALRDCAGTRIDTTPPYRTREERETAES